MTTKNIINEHAENLHGYTVDDILIATAQEAEDVLRQMINTVNDYGVVTVHDYYEFVGKVGKPYDVNYGWVSLETADIIKVGDGYTIKLSEPKPIEY